MISKISALASDPEVRRGEFGLLLTVFLSALVGLRSRDRTDRELAAGYFEAGECFFLLCEALEIKSKLLRDKVLNANRTFK